MTQQDHAAWRLYCIAPRPNSYLAWDHMPIEQKIIWRIKANRAMLIANAPHRH